MSRLGSGIPLVARQQELRVLDDGLRRAGSGRAGAVLLSGDAGVGKSRLLAELLGRARVAGHAVLLGRCLDTAEAALPYLPFAEAVLQLQELDPELIGNHDALLRLLPHQPAGGGAHRDDRELGQLQLFDALYSAVSELAAARTTILAIEDLHWADRSSRDLLAFLLSRLDGQHLLVVGTFRSDDLHRRHPLRPLLAELLRLPAVERLHLNPFDPAETEAFVRSLADQSLSDEVVAGVAERSEGNAFMAEELLSAYSEQMPHELAEILLARAERLSPATLQVIRLASVIGRRFGHERIAAAAHPQLAADELDEALREAVAHNVLVTEESGGTYAFRHALLREAIYVDLLPGERSRLHARVADALLGVDQPGVAAELAHHSMESHDLAGALAASVRAAYEADQLGAPAERLIHAERALQMWRVVDNPEQVSSRAMADVSPDLVTELRLTRWAATAAAAAGEPDRAIAHSRAALDLADAHGDDLEAADLRRRYAQYLWTLSGSEQQTYDVAWEAWQRVRDREPSAVKAWVQAIVARACLGLDSYGEAAEMADATIRTASDVPEDPEASAAHADALITLTVCDQRKPDSVAAGRRRLAEAVELAGHAEAHGVELRARYNLGMSWLEEGRLPEALAEFDAAVERAAATRLTWSAYGLELRVVQVICRFMSGDWDGSEAAAQLAGEAVSGTVVTRVSAGGLLVTVGRGRFDVAERRLAHLRERWQTDTQVMTLLGVCGAELEMWRGSPDIAARWAEQALHWLQQYDTWHLAGISLGAMGVAAYADQAEAARGAGDHEGEQRAVAGGDALVAMVDDILAQGHVRQPEIGPEGRAYALRAKAEATRLHGRREPAVWRQLVEAFGYGEMYRQAQARWRLAEALLGSGDRQEREEAVAELRLASQVADRLGAAPLGDAVRALARRGRITLDGFGDSAAAGDGDAVQLLLTPREQAVLALVASGRTNRQVGAELFISDKTVSVHLSRVMAKLGVASRTEAVSAAYLRGLLTTPGESAR